MSWETQQGTREVTFQTEGIANLCDLTQGGLQKL
jgi:hypothetical protein